MNTRTTYVFGIIIILMISSITIVFFNLDPLHSSNKANQIDNKNNLYFNSTQAFEYLTDQVNIGYRYPGSPEINLTRAFIVEQLSLWHWKILFDNFTFLGIDVSNILAFPENSTNSTLDSTLLFGAHYDTRIKADRDVNSSARNTPVLGANDGASGVAVLLEMARIYRNSTNIGLLFIDAEDQGGVIPGWDYLEGTYHFTNNLDTFFPHGAESISYFILFDMIGDWNLNIKRELNSDPNLVDQIWASALILGYQDSFLNEYGYSMIDDHIPFKHKGIRVVDLIDFDYVDENGQNLHHTTHDNLNYVSASSLKIVGRTIEYWLNTQKVYSIS
ncbi:MAG: M28 family peptidase [Candidatus Thorarchaeota archaeon]